MALDQSSSAPNELRPINVARNVIEDPRIVPATSASATSSAGRHAGEGFYMNLGRETDNSPHSIPVFYPPAGMPDTGFGGLGYGSAVPATWYPHHGAVGPAGHMSVNPALGMGYSPNLVMGVSGNAVDQMGNSEAATNFGVWSNLGTQIAGNLANQAGSESAGSFGVVSPNVVSRVGGGGIDQSLGGNGGGISYTGNSGTRANGGGSEYVGCDSGSGTGSRSDSFKRISGSGADHASEDGGEDSVSGKKVKFLCSFGGKIFPRPSDGMLRYVGGQTRIISVRKDVSFDELVQKMVETYGQPVVIKYQLPDEDLDALVSVSCPEDLDNMMDEYEKLVERSSDGSAKLRVFLFSASEFDPSGMTQFRDLHDSGQRYMEAVNGIMDGVGGGITRKESIASATSTQNSDISGNNEVVDSSILAQAELTRPPATSNVSPKSNPSVSKEASKLFFVDPNPPAYSETSTVSSFGIPPVQSSAAQVQSPHMEVEPEKPVPLSGPQPVPYGMQAYMDPTKESITRPVFVGAPPLMGFPSSHLSGTTGPVYTQQQFPDGSGSGNQQQYVSPVHMTLGPAASQMSMRQPFIQQPLIHHPQQPQFEHDGSSSGQRIVFLPMDPNHSSYHHQVGVSPTVGGGYGWHPVFPPGQVIVSDGSTPNSQQEKLQMWEDCYMCQKALPHAHSDPVFQDQRDNRAGSGVGHSPISVYHSLPVEDSIRSRTPSKPMVDGGSGEGITEPASGIQSSIAAHMEVPYQYGMFAGSMPQSSPDPQHFVNKPMNAQVCTVGVSPVQGSDQQFQGLPLEYSKLLDARLETFQISASEMPPSSDKSNQLLINDHSMAETLKSKQHQQQHNPQAEMLLDISEVPYRQEFLTGESSEISQPSELGLPRSQSQSKMGIQLDPQDIYNDNLGFTTERIPSAGVWMDEKSIFQPLAVPSDAEAVSLNGDRQSFTPPLSRTEDLQDDSNSLFKNQDPFNMHSDAHFPPPKPIKIALRKEALGTRDPFLDISSGNVGDFNTGDLHSTNDLGSEQVQALREEQVKQELQDVAEGVVASVLLSTTSSELGLTVSDGNQGAQERTPDEEVRKVDAEPLFEANSEDIEAKLSEKGNFGVPEADGIGRLQIIKNSDLEELRELGSGTYGTVYHGKWRGTDVAIKRINDRCFTGKPSEQDRMRNDFWNEAIKLADLHHPNVVAFYGVVIDGPGGSVATVTEYMVNGSLRTALQKSERNLDKRKRLLIAMDVAFGMEYLHGKNIVHFDLKSDNLLVNLRDPHRPICKVGDLGLSKVKCQTLISGGVRGTLPWMAPELLNGSSSLVSEKVDVFSYGIVLWELLTGEEPYKDLHYGAIIGGIVSNTLRPPVPESCETDWRSLMERCWSSEPSERPSFTEIVNELRSMSGKLPSKPQNHQ